MTSDGNTQIEKVSASLVKAVPSEDLLVVAIICEIRCVPRIESITGNVTLVVSWLLYMYHRRFEQFFYKLSEDGNI